MSNARNLARLIPNSSGQIPASSIPDASITTAKLADLSVSTAKIIDSAATPAKIDKPYQMVVNTGGYTVPDGTNNIFYDVLVESRGMSHNSNTNMVFTIPGRYKITTGWRFGAGGDVWTGVQLADSNGNIVAKGYGSGQVTNDPGPMEVSFIASITSAHLNTSMRMRFFRAGSTMAIADPNDSAGYAIVTTVEWVGQ